MKAELKKAIDEIASQGSLLSEETDRLMKRVFSLADTAEEKREAGAYLRAMIGRRKRPDVDVKGILGEAADMLNLSYIAKRYFNKERSWLYQRLNQSLVNGKPAAFTESELKKLSDSLKEISDTISQISIQLTH